jgi:uncharacterized protein (TIGR02246 family)
MLRRPLLLAFLLVGCSSPAGGQGEATVRALLAEQSEAWNRHDARAWCAPFTEDAEFVNILGMLLKGRSQIEQRHAELFQGIFAKSRIVVTTRKVRSLGATSALAETDYELRGYDRLPPGFRPTDADGTLRTRMSYVLTLTPDGWRIISAQNTAIMPMPSR